MADIQPAPAGSWQWWSQQEAAGLGVNQTSGYRSPGANAAAGGSPTSLHMTGTPSLPGAMDFGGSAAQLTEMFDAIKQAFAGRIRELYLNIPTGTSQDIRNNQAISSNPEYGNPQHLHVALTGPSGAVPVGTPANAPAEAIPLQNQGSAALTATGGTSTAAGGSECSSQWCMPSLLGGTCHCWSDVWAYGAAVALIGGGALLMFTGSGRR